MTVTGIPVEVILELIFSFPCEASKCIDDSHDNSSSLVFSYPQIKVVTETDLASFSKMMGTLETMEDSILVRSLIKDGTVV